MIIYLKLISSYQNIKDGSPYLI